MKTEMTMKAVMIIYNLALTEKIEYSLDRLGIRGYTQWDNVEGMGSFTGVPHLGTHTLARDQRGHTYLCRCRKRCRPLLEAVKRIDAINTGCGYQGLRLGGGAGGLTTIAAVTQCGKDCRRTGQTD
ncbi:MAG: hypothetical protein MZV63_18930 [Marinilabiliales bacterium]|nr:hypothetical protein [Marinilabiliales bacterium]